MNIFIMSLDSASDAASRSDASLPVGCEEAADNPAMTTPATYRMDEDSLREAIQQQPSLVQAASESASTRVRTIIQASKNEHGWRRIVRNFSPSWFSVTMGTGVVGTLFALIPWQASWLYYLSIIFFVLNVVLFCAAMTLSVLRYTIWPEIWGVMIQDSTNSLFLATMPIGFATIIEMWLFVCVPWGDWTTYVAWAWWIIDCALAVAVTISMGIILYVSSTSQQPILLMSPQNLVKSSAIARHHHRSATSSNRRYSRRSWSRI